MNLRQILLAIAISAGLTLATVSQAQQGHYRWWRKAPAPTDTTAPAPADTTAPTTPSGLAASAVTSSSLTLAWSAATDNVGVTGYRVYCNGTLVVSPSSTSVQITELLPGGTCSFTVSAFDAAGNVSAPSAPLSVTTPASVPAPAPVLAAQVAWSAGMETGSVAEWSEKVNSDSADTVASRDFAHSGSWSMKQSVTGAKGGTRMQRYPELDALARAGTPFYWTWWDYFPTSISFGSNDMFMLWGTWSVKTAVPNAPGDPLWGLYFHNTGNTLDLVFNATWNAGLPATKVYNSPIPVPIGRWNKFEIFTDPAGHITVWLNGQMLFDLSGVMTVYPQVGQTPLLFGIEQTGYGSNLTPIPFVHYVDDVTVSLGRVN